MEERDTLRYSIWDPTGNITALVESEVAVERQLAVAAALMRRHPGVEQVGFVRMTDGSAEDGIRARLRMAGGEFCGNAAMSTAALCRLHVLDPDGQGSVWIRVSGVKEPVEVRLRPEGPDCFLAAIRMPAPREIREADFSFEGVCGRLPLVRMEGISHLLIEPGTAFCSLLRDREAAGRAVRTWCEELEAEGLGLMFLEGDRGAYRLTPLVYIPGSGTEFWENSCASGSSAVGMALAARSGIAIRLSLCEPGGTLEVESDPIGSETWLSGATRRIARF